MALNSRSTTTERNIQRASHHFIYKREIAGRYLDFQKSPSLESLGDILVRAKL